MRGDRTGNIGFLDELFGFGASGSGLIGIGVDIGLRDRGIIRLPPRLARLLMQQVAGPFRGRARTRTIVRDRIGICAWIRISLKKGSPRILLPGAARTRTIVRIIRSPSDLCVRSKKKIKKVFFVVDQGSNGCYNIVRQQPLAACCGIPRGP